MKIVSYNLRSGGTTGVDNSWSRLLAGFDPDVICAQESLHPNTYLSSVYEHYFQNGCVYEKAPHGLWGSAILSKSHKLEPISLAIEEYRGYVVGARMHGVSVGGISQAVVVISIHAPTPYDVSVNRILDEIATRWGKVPMIIAGDFNLTTAVRHRTEDLWSKKDSFAEIHLREKFRRDLGMFNAWQVLHPNENLPQTLRWSGNKASPYHCDGIFLSANFLTNLVSADIENSECWQKISDHNPIVVELD